MKKYIIAGSIGPSIDAYILTKDKLVQFLEDLFLKHSMPNLKASSIISDANSRGESRFYTQNNEGGKFYWVVKPNKITTGITISAR